LKVNSSLIDTLEAAISTEITSIGNNLINDLAEKLQTIDNQISEINKKLSEPEQLFQDYQKKLNEWETKRIEIIGNPHKAESLQYYSTIIDYLNKDLQNDILNERQARKEKVLQLLKEKSEIIKINKELYKPVEDFIKDNKATSDVMAINLDVAFEVKGFTDRFFNYVYRNKGSFYGSQEGASKLNKILSSFDFNQNSGVLGFLDEIQRNLEFDTREDVETKKSERKTNIDSIVDPKLLHEFYNYLFKLEYIEPVFKLKLGTKELEQLSPGEKGGLLLIFYLLLDRQDIPLIIDQPEENLDNQSVSSILVPYIKEAKKRRQIFIVTHNPNLAVVCDAEQVIHVKIEKDNFYKISTKSGSIEHPVINQTIIDVLEGTLPAFENRDWK
jgi:hypothetical protein